MNEHTDTDVIFSRPIEVEKVSNAGSHERITADDEECARLAELLSLEAITELKAALKITPWRKQGVKIAGSLRAGIRQKCVVTLEPFDSVVEDTIERYYFRGNRPGPSGQVITIDPLDDQDTEPFEGNTIDAGELIRESLTLALDPYPRKPGASFTEGSPSEDDRIEENPFAVLKNLKQPH